MDFNSQQMAMRHKARPSGDWKRRMLSLAPEAGKSSTTHTSAQDAQYRGLNNYLYHVGGSLLIY